MIVPTTRNLVIIGAFVAVCGLAAAGWMRKNDRPADNGLLANQANPYSSQSGYANPQTVFNNPQPGYGTVQTGYGSAQTGYVAGQTHDNGNYAPTPPSAYSNDGYYPSRMRPVYVRQNEVVQEQPLTVNQAPRRVYQEQEYYTDSRGRRRGRSKTHSVEIVAGTAAVGAVIGGLAGGGKGAGIGALSGGGAGFAYDRLTHNH